ncbi:MAG: ABC transporter permease [Oscillospiraceae bacterium]|nr:ABC transporter permease [Oscillospiraceae bacterium]
MAKLVTPEMEKINKKLAREKKTRRAANSPGMEAWIRLKRNKLAVVGMIIILALILVAIFADFIAPYSYDAQDYKALKMKPCAEHIFGTDQYGRDIFSRMVYGTRYSLPMGLISVFFIFLIGGTLGAIAGYCGGRVDNVIMRVLDVFQSIPSMLMAIAVAASLGTGAVNLVIAIGISSAPGRARVVRSAILSVKNNDYIESARAIGASSRRQLLKYMLPNALAPILTAITFSVATCILIISSMSYLGLGIPAPAPEWGSMLADSRSFMRSHPYMLVFPGAAIMITVLALNLFGDGLRDAFDPRLK